MADHETLEPHPGTGALQSPPDERDFSIEELLATTGQRLEVSPPASFRIATQPPILNQGNTPMCVAFSTSGMKSYEDRKDQGHYFNFDESTFFRQIGGGPNGAVIRVALDRLLHYGYPVVNSGDAVHHKIRAYYAIPKTVAGIKAAIFSFAPLIFGTPWYHSWFHPIGTAGHRRLPPPDYTVGGHAIMAVGYNSVGVILRNSWGPNWGDSGDVIMPWAYVLHSVWEIWKALDVVGD